MNKIILGDYQFSSFYVRDMLSLQCSGYIFAYVTLQCIREISTGSKKFQGEDQVNRNAITMMVSGQDTRITSLLKRAENLFQVCEVRTWLLLLIGNHSFCQHSRS